MIAVLASLPCFANEDCDCVPTDEVECTAQDLLDGLSQTCLMGRCVDGCRDDDAEPNDSLEAAVALTFEDEFDSGEQGPFKACDGSLGGT